MSRAALPPPRRLRRHDLDWLRVLLFALLVVHHAAVGFAPFGAEIYGFANDRLGGDLLSLFIYFSHTWRLPALFLIAGIGSYFATAHGIGGRFLARRMSRLLVPALFGTLVLNLVAGYAIARATGAQTGLAALVRDWWRSPAPHQVMHLWFLVNLAIYTLLCWPLYVLRARLERIAVPPVWLVAGLAVVVTAVAMLTKPHAAALAGDGYQFFWYGAIFAAGYVIGAQHVRVLCWAARVWPALLAAGLAGFLLEVTLLAQALARDPALGQALASGGWAAAGLAPAHGAVPMLFAAAEGANAWAFSLTAMGLCARYLDRPGGLLPALSRATFPVYVLHFPITIAGLAVLAGISWPWGLELALLVAGVFALTLLIYRAADRAGPLIYLIGGRPRGAAGARRSGEPV